MSIGASAVLTALLDHAHALGVFEVARLGEFKSPPPNALCFALWVETLGPAPNGSGLAATTAMLQCTAQIYHPAFHKPESDVELKVTGAADAYLGRVSGDYTLGGLVRNVDLLGEMGDAPSWSCGYVTIDAKVSRTATVNLNMIFNDAWTQAE